MKYTLLSLALVSLPIASDAKRMTAAQFLATASNDYRLRNNRELTAYFSSAKTSTPYLDKIELRSETDRFEILRQRYALRFYPKGWGETSYTRQLTETTNQSNRLADQAIFNAALLRRYQLLLDHLELTSLLDLQRQQLTVHKDRITVMRRQSTTVVNFDVTTLITAENKYIDQRLAMVRLEDRLTSTKHKIAVIVGGPAEIALPRQELLPIAEIAKLARTVKPAGKIDNIYLRRRRLRIKLADVKYRLEVAKSRDYLSFLKVEFDTADYDRPERAFSVGFALRMPFINPDRYDANRRKVDFLEEKLLLEEERRKTSERIVLLSRSLRRLLAQQKILRDRKSDGDAEVSFKRYLAMEGVNPLTLLKIKESILRGDARLTEIEHEIRQRHLALLNVLGRLGQRPLRNLISAKGEVLR